MATIDVHRVITSEAQPTFFTRNMRSKITVEVFVQQLWPMLTCRRIRADFFGPHILEAYQGSVAQFVGKDYSKAVAVGQPVGTDLKIG